MQTITTSKLGLSDFDVKWGTFEFGGVDKVTPKLQLITKPKTLGSVGAVELGQWVVGLSGSILVEAREIDHTFYEKTIPWNSGSTTASIPLTPAALNADLYDYAAKLTLHPSGLATNVTNLDLTLLKAVPLSSHPGERDGENPDVNVIEFIFFPDLTKLNSLKYLVYGYLGPEPA